MKKQKINLKSIVADILDRWPEVIPIFLKYQMKCVGCSMAAFEVLTDALNIYGIPADQFLDEVNDAVDESETSSTQ